MKRQFDFGWLSTERAVIMGFAILWVIFFHSSFDCSSMPALEQIKKHGNIGVDIFLLLSGIGLYYTGQKIGMGRVTSKVCRFYKARLKRILPATIICLLPWYIYLYIDRGRSFVTWKFVLEITSLSYWIDGTNRAWYIALSLVMYAIYPVIFIILIKKCNGGNMVLCCLAIIISSVMINISIALLATNWFENVELALTRIPVFIFGCFLGPSVKANKKCSGWLVLIAAVAIIILPWGIQLYRNSFESERFYLWRYLNGLMGFCITVVLASLFTFVHGSIIEKFFLFFGKYTLEIYLTHTQIQTVLKEQCNNLSSATIGCVAIIVTISISIVLHEILSKINGIRKKYQ